MEKDKGGQDGGEKDKAQKDKAEKEKGGMVVEISHVELLRLTRPERPGGTGGAK